MTQSGNTTTRKWRLAAFALIPLALAGALYLDSLPGKPYIPPPSAAARPAPPTVPLASFKTLEARVATLEAQRLEPRSPSAPAAPSATETPSVPETPAADAPAPTEEITAELAALRQELAALQQRLEQESPHRNVQLVALYKLERQVWAGVPFTQALDVLLQDPELPESVHLKLHPLTALADKGIHSEKTLLEAFSQTAEAFASGVETGSEDSADTWEQIRRNLASLVTVRKIGDPDGEGDDARIARAEQALADGALTGAIEELSALSSVAAPYFDEWLKHARQREKTMHRIERARTLLEEESPSTPPASSPDSV